MPNQQKIEAIVNYARANVGSKKFEKFILDNNLKERVLAIKKKVLHV